MSIKTDKELLQDWLEQKENISISSYTNVGGSCDYTVNSIEKPWEKQNEDGTWNIESFTIDSEDSCSFSQGSKNFTLTSVELPSDRWGNTATYDDGLLSGIQLGYSDTAYSEYNLDKIFHPIDCEVDDLDEFDESEFIGWVENNHPEIIDKIEEELTCSGFYCGWTIHTTNKELNSPEWQAIAKQYLGEVYGQ